MITRQTIASKMSDCLSSKKYEELADWAEMALIDTRFEPESDTALFVEILSYLTAADDPESDESWLVLMEFMKRLVGTYFPKSVEAPQNIGKQAKGPLDILTAPIDPVILSAIAAHNRHAKSDAIFAKFNLTRELIDVWRLEDGRFEEVDAQRYYDAMGEDRSKWPKNTFTFRIKKWSNDRVVVVVENIYIRGIVPTSRGGNSDELTLTLVEGQWQARWEEGMRWD